MGTKALVDFARVPFSFFAIIFLVKTFPVGTVFLRGRTSKASLLANELFFTSDQILKLFQSLSGSDLIKPLADLVG